MPESRDRIDRRNRIKAAVAEIRAQTFCARCGGQPIDWHSLEHDQNYDRRVGRMANAPYALETILAEIARCTPLCRSCHMAEDGRHTNLELGRRGSRPIVHCSECGREARPSRRGLCGRCYERLGRAGLLEGVNCYLS